LPRASSQRLQLRNEPVLLHQSEALRQAVAQRHDGDLLGEAGPHSTIASTAALPMRVTAPYAEEK
jgi:hypothetical protein